MTDRPAPSVCRLLADLHTYRLQTMVPADLQINIDQRQLLEDTADRAVPAAPGSPRALADLVDGDLLAALDAEVLGYLRCARAAAPYMIAQGWGRIINISGLAARSVSTPSGSIRNVAAALTKTLADELGPAGINVTVVHPG